jgi:predicted small secreted protein
VEVSKIKSRRRVACALLLACSLVLAACAAGPNDVAGSGAMHLAGFWQGLWHGAISPITFLVSLFNHDVGMYEVHNDGAWYNFGFLIGVMLVFSGGGAGSRRTDTTRTPRAAKPS